MAAMTGKPTALPALVASLLATSSVMANAAQCDRRTVEKNYYIICSAQLPGDTIELHLKDKTGQVLGSFKALQQRVKAAGRKLLFAFNAGMYHPDRRPVGLFVSRGRQLAPIQTGRGSGNFSLKPNGVFFVESGRAVVRETARYRAENHKPRLATQSGPMLVIDNKIHPKFRRDSDSRKIRNGIGVSANGKTVYFALALNLVNFHSFARLFRDHLKTPNALYLDGSISQVYSPQAGRTDTGTHMGPMIAVTSARSR